MKRVISIILIGVVCLGLFACNKKVSVFANGKGYYLNEVQENGIEYTVYIATGDNIEKHLPEVANTKDITNKIYIYGFDKEENGSIKVNCLYDKKLVKIDADKFNTDIVYIVTHSSSYSDLGDNLMDYAKTMIK